MNKLTHTALMTTLCLIGAGCSVVGIWGALHDLPRWGLIFLPATTALAVALWMDQEDRRGASGS